MANYRDAQLHLAGDWRWADGQRVINRAAESVLCTVPNATRADRDYAFAAAEQCPGGR
jgi:acyl-CoA reductase-like NAD-dependent aldehyde dehydrogenase